VRSKQNIALWIFLVSSIIARETRHIYRLLPEKLTVIQRVKKSLESKCSLPFSEESVIGLCHEPVHIHMHLNIDRPFMPWFFKYCLPSRFSEYLNTFPIFPMRAVCPPSDTYFFDHTNNIWWIVQIVKLLMNQFFQPPVTYSLLGPDIFLSTLLSNALTLYSFRNVRDHVSHPYRTCKIIVLCVLTFMFSRSLWTEFPELNLIWISSWFWYNSI
jgi:hypothetical protein